MTLEQMIAATNAEAAETEAPERPAPAPAPSDAPSPEDGPRPDDDEQNPDLPQLSRGQTRRLFEQWEKERRPRFFKDLEAAQQEAEQLKAASAREMAEADEARRGYEEWYGAEDQYKAAERVHDAIVGRLERGEYVPDSEINSARWYAYWKKNRGMAGTVHQTETAKVLGNVDRLFRQAKVDEADVTALLAEVSQKKGHPGTVLELVAEKVRAEWKGRYEAEKAAHEATRARFGLGRAASAESGGRAPVKGDGIQQLMNTDFDGFIERAKRGEFANLDLSDR
jgi:hypothetical protein